MFISLEPVGKNGDMEKVRYHIDDIAKYRNYPDDNDKGRKKSLVSFRKYTGYPDLIVLHTAEEIDEMIKNPIKPK